jgi:hemerythrin-like domain-containing protein
MKRIVDVGDAFERISADCILQTEICLALESLADSLPNSINTDLASRLPTILNSSWSEHVGFQEDVIFPILKRHHAHSPTLVDQIAQLEIEHGTIGDSGQEITEQLELALEGAEPNADMFGYMLRSAFHDRRRHIEIEHRLFAAMLPAQLPPVDRDLLRRWLSSHAWPLALFSGETSGY